MGATIAYDPDIAFRVALDARAPTGEASLREHAVAWHPRGQCYVLVADVVPLASPHHPNTYNTELHLWSSPDLRTWAYGGVAVPKGRPGANFDGYGTASPAGMACFGDRLVVPFSGRRTAAFGQRAIGLAWSGADPLKLPWTKVAAPVSDLPGEDDDPAVLAISGDPRLHLYHRTAGPAGYRIVHTASASPEDVSSWPKAVPICERPETVRAQELTGAVYAAGAVHLFVIEHLHVGGIRIAWLCARDPGGPFGPAVPGERYLQSQPSPLAYGGHITPVVRDERFTAFFWTVPQAGARYGLLGHPVP